MSSFWGFLRVYFKLTWKQYNTLLLCNKRLDSGIYQAPSAYLFNLLITPIYFYGNNNIMFPFYSKEGFIF